MRMTSFCYLSSAAVFLRLTLSFTINFYDEAPNEADVANGDCVGLRNTLNTSVHEGAFCADGTDPFYYVYNGTGDGVDKWAIYLNGGAWCARHTSIYGSAFNSGSCRTRASGYNTNYVNGQFKQFAVFGRRNYLSNAQGQNPMMYNWNKVFILNCDFQSFTGNLDDPIDANGDTLYYRGHRILKGILQELLDLHGMDAATDVVLGGLSAGGLAVMLNGDWMYEYVLKPQLSPDTRVSLLSDSGYFPDSNGYGSTTSYADGMRWLFDNNNASYGSVNEDCIEFYGGRDSENASNCIFAPYAVQFIKLPMYSFQSKYDNWLSQHIWNVFNNDAAHEILSDEMLDKLDYGSANMRRWCWYTPNMHGGGWLYRNCDDSNTKVDDDHQTFYNSKVIKDGTCHDFLYVDSDTLASF